MYIASSSNAGLSDNATPLPSENPSASEKPYSVAPGEIAIGVVIGRASEYFDFFVYAIASVLIFPKVYFPFLSPLEGTLYAFTIFSFAFLARPLGTMISLASRP